MSRILFHCVLFCVGVMLAFGFVRYSAWLRDARLPPTASLEGVEFPSTRSNPEANAAGRFALSLGEVTSERRIRLFEEALRGSSETQMQILRLEDLRAIPQYRSQLLPRLKLVALEELLSRFSEADWRTWPIGSLDAHRKPTPARTFVDLLWQVNSDLARFLETSAYLLHGMFTTISSGKPYPIRQDLQFLMMNAKEVLSARRSAARDGESAFDHSLLQDPSVYLSFERIRGELTKRFIREHPYQREAHFTLLLDLDPRVYDAELRTSLKESLQNLSLNASGNYRAEILPAVVDSRLLSLLAAEDRRIARALAQLYLVGSVDAIEAGRSELAHRLLLRSESTFGGLEAQQVMGRFIEEQRKAQRDSSGTAPVTKAIERAVVEEPAAPAQIGWFTLVILALLGIALLYGLRVVWERRSTSQVRGALREPKRGKNAQAAPRSKISDPSQVEFAADPLDSDIDFDLSQAVNR